MSLTQQEQIVKNLFKEFFDVTITYGQIQIATQIIFRDNKRVQVMTPTQYGKSFVVAGAILLAMAIQHAKFIIVSTSTEKASIIMGYVIDLIGKDPLFYGQLDLDFKDVTQRLQTERSKKTIDFNMGGSVSILSVDARNGRRNIEAAMGKGGQNIILDESALLEDVLYATVKRMLGGWGDDAFLLEIGNPFYRNHFHRTWHSKRYHKIFIDYHQALEEGRYTQNFIDEMKEEALFDILYGVKFPEENEIDQKGFRQLLTEQEVINCQERSQHEGELSLGCDIGGGGDDNVYTVRSRTYASVFGHNRSADTMTNVGEIEHAHISLGIAPEYIAIDDVGIGRGVSDRLKEKGFAVQAVSAGSRPKDPDKFANIKAENYWKLRDWIKGGGKLEPNDKWIQLSWIKYKVNSDKVIVMESKADLKKRTGKSPDFAESLMLTFSEPDAIEVIEDIDI